MIPTLHLVRARLPRMLLFGILPTLMFLPIVLRSPEASPEFAESAARRALSFVTVFSVIWGMVFSSLVQEALHCPFAMILPHAGRKIIGGHALFLAVVAGVFTALSRHAAPGLPVVPVTALSLALLAFTLPFEEPRRWSKFPGAFGVVFALMIFNGPVASFLKRWIESSSLTLTFAGLGVAAACFAIVSSRERRRGWAGIPYTSAFNAVFSAKLTRQMQQECLASEDFSKKHLNAEPNVNSTRWWIKAIRHERANEMGGTSWFAYLGIGVLVTILVLILPPLFRRSAETFHEGVLNAFSNSSRSATNSLIYILAMQAFLPAVPRGRVLYPISRATRLAIVYRSTIAQLGLGCVALCVGTGLLWVYVSQISHVPVPAQSWFGVLAIASTGLIFAPILLCGRVWQDVSDSRLPSIVALAMTFVLGAIASGAIWGDTSTWPEYGVPMARLTICAALIVLSQLACYAGLRNFYVNGDLVQR